MKKNSLVEGTIIAYIAIIITKILGALYVIPFYKIIGETGGILYSYAYNIYNLFLNISTSGIPVAISIIISEFIALKMFKAKEKSLRVANVTIFLISLFAFLIMFIFAKPIALFFISGLSNSTSINDVSLVIRVMSFCLLIIPFLSVIRGYLQGHKYIGISSISQVIEQVVRIFVVLVGSYIVINILKLKVSIGVSVALFGAFVGGLVAYLYLKYKIKKSTNLLDENEKIDPNEKEVSSKEILKKIIKYSIPIIIISISQNLYELTDLKLIIKGLYLIGYSAKESELIASVIVTWGPKICMIINSLALGLSASLIPHMVESFVSKDYKELNRKFNQAVNTVLIVTIPLALGLIFLANPIYYLFYGASKYGGAVLGLLAVVSVLATMHIVVNMSLQGMGKFKIVYINTLVGLVVNALLDIPMILLLNKIGINPFLGSLVATTIGQSTSLIIVFIYLKKEFKFGYSPILNLILKILIPSIIMSIVIIVLKLFIPINTNNYLILFLTLVLYAFISGIIYVVIVFKNNALYDAFGKNQVNNILKKLKLKK